MSNCLLRTIQSYFQEEKSIYAEMFENGGYPEDLYSSLLDKYSHTCHIWHYSYNTLPDNLTKQTKYNKRYGALEFVNTKTNLLFIVTMEDPAHITLKIIINSYSQITKIPIVNGKNEHNKLQIYNFIVKICDKLFEQQTELNSLFKTNI